MALAAPGTTLQTAPLMAPTMDWSLKEETTLANGSSNGACSGAWTGALRRRWCVQTAPPMEPGLAPFFRPRDWRQNGTPRRHRSIGCKWRCCAPFFDHRSDAKTTLLTGIAPIGVARKTALRLVFIMFNFFIFLFVLVRRISRK